MKFNIQINPLNPVEYLAVCGVFEILARFDFTADSWWDIGPPRFWIESKIDEAALLNCIIETLSDWNQWQKGEENQSDEALILEDEVESNEESTNEEEEENNDGISLSLRFSMNDKNITLNLDWWYETLNSKKEVKKKSAWKMYAGQQTAEKISQGMTEVAGLLLKRNEVKNITELIKLFEGMTGRFGFDPRSSHNALDVGYSPNDLNLPVATYPFAEMLTTIAVQHFFPQRNHQDRGITSSRGWTEKEIFQYALWKRPLPITLARMAAIGPIDAINKNDLILLQAKRANRDKYSNFKMAKVIA